MLTLFEEDALNKGFNYLAQSCKEYINLTLKVTKHMKMHYIAKYMHQQTTKLQS